MVKVGNHYFDVNKIWQISELVMKSDKAIGCINLIELNFKKDVENIQLYEKSVKEYQEMFSTWKRVTLEKRIEELL